MSVYSPVKGRSVPACRSTLYSASVSCSRHSASDLTTFGVAPVTGSTSPTVRVPDPYAGYRCLMAGRDRPEDDPVGPQGRFADDLIGLDPADPEVQAFAAHLDRMERTPPSFTVEGSLAGVRDFAESANRTQGPRRAATVLVVGLILLGVAFTLWEAAAFIVTVLFG